MNIDDLLNALRGANVTINIQGGEHNTMYTGPVQKNRYYGGERRRSEPRCSICGQSGGADLYSHAFSSYTHQSCLEEEGRKARLKRAERNARTWQIVSRSTPMLEEAQPAPQIAAPVEAEVIDPQEQWARNQLQWFVDNIES